VQVEIQALRGGLMAAVARVVAQIPDPSGRPRSFTFVVKRLDGALRREAMVYRRLLEPLTPGAAPGLLGVDDVGPDRAYLYLEYVRPSRAWPWMEVALSGLVLERLAAFHALAPAVVGDALVGWDYEADLRESAATTLALYERVVGHEELASLRPVRGALRRLVDALPAVRRTLLAAQPTGVAVLHGDTHSGNALVRVERGAERVVLLDWARARPGSPLEDVSSWLQSLGYWEPVARQRHDTLLRRYLAARGVSTQLSRELRDAYWLAGACNVLAGALRYHLFVADGWGGAPSHARAAAVRASRDHLRVIRRADAVWRR
jgi:hypothetical protein